jgi:acyl dehydratase
MPIASIEDIQSKVGTEVGVSDWILVDQARIDSFAEITEDPQFIHIMAPVRSGKRIRGRFALARFEEKRPGQWQFVHNVTVEIEGEEKPALVADWIGLIFV